jgi:hypothetical protein
VHRRSFIGIAPAPAFGHRVRASDTHFNDAEKARRSFEADNRSRSIPDVATRSPATGDPGETGTGATALIETHRRAAENDRE